MVERFASSPAVLKSCMRHNISGRPMGPVMVGELQKSQSFFDGLKLHQQVWHASSYSSARMHAGSGFPFNPCHHRLLLLRWDAIGCWVSFQRCTFLFSLESTGGQRQLWPPASTQVVLVHIGNIHVVLSLCRW